MFAPHGRTGKFDLEFYGRGQRIHIDGSLAPRTLQNSSALCWIGMGQDDRIRNHIRYHSSEVPQGQFFRHELDTGYTAIQWWDRVQGDSRGACNSTILLEGKRSTEEMLRALESHFPSVLKNLQNHNIPLIELTKP